MTFGKVMHAVVFVLFCFVCEMQNSSALEHV